MSMVERTTPARSAEAADRLSRTAWHVAMGALAILPVGMAIAHRSSPVFLGLAAFASVLAIWLEGGLSKAVRTGATRLRTPLGLTCLGFLSWSLLSIAWSEFPATSLMAFGEFTLSVIFAFVLAVILAPRMTRTAFIILALSCAIAAIMMVIELRTGMALRRALHVRAVTFIFNRPTLTLMVLMPAVVAWLSQQGRLGWLWAAAIVIPVTLMIARSESGAAVVGSYAVGAVFVAAYLAPRAVAFASAVAFTAVIGLAPYLGPIGDQLIPNAVHKRFAAAHSRDRIDIWLSFDDAIRQDPMLGAGFGISPLMDKTSVADRVQPGHRTLLGVGHPHNAAIQIWAELGIVGAMLTLMIILQVLLAITRQPRILAAASLALLAGATAVALVGHGAWQGWWAASLGAAIVWLLAARGANPVGRVETTR